MTAKSFLLLVVFLTICVPAAAQKPRSTPTPSANSFAAARNFLKHGNLVRAREAALAGLKAAPPSAQGYNLLGIIYMQEQDFDEAQKVFEHALALDPRSSATHNNLANCYAQQKKMDLAEKEYRTTLRIAPGDPVANYNLGVILLARGQPGAAIPYSLKVVPPDLSSEMNLVHAYLRAGQTRTGLAYAHQVSEKRPNDANLHYCLGIVLAEENQFEAAEHELEIAGGLKPKDYDILLSQGKASLHCKHYGKALSALTRALLIKPDSVEALEGVGRAYFEMGRDIDALQALLKAHNLAPKNTSVIFLLARVSMANSYYEDAISLLEAGIKIAPLDAELHAALGECYFQSGKTGKGIEEFENLRKLDPTARPYAFLSFCYRYMGRYDDAREAALKGLKINPRNIACLFNLGAILNIQGDRTGAEKYLDEAIKIDPGYDQALLELATLKMSAGKYDEAIPLLRHDIAVSHSPSQAYYKLAMAERGLHQYKQANMDLKTFQTLSKDQEHAAKPFQNFFEFASRRETLPPKERLELDLKTLQAELKQHPSDPENLYMLADTQMKLGHLEEGMCALGRLEQASGQDPRTELEIGVLLARYHWYGDAAPHFKRALAANPNSDDARYDLADADFHLRDYRGAFEALQQVSATGRDDSYLFLLGNVVERIGRTAEAAKIFQQAVQMNPDNDQNYLALALTDMRAGNIDEAERVLQQGLVRVPDSARIHWGVARQNQSAHGSSAACNANARIATRKLKRQSWADAQLLCGVFF
jgi:tetratricopeptide (TPR) repeat protein